jgi:hypothetical protein
MVRLIRRIWAEFWLPATVNDAELCQLLALQPHHLMRLAAALHDRQPAAFIATKHGRLWRLRYTLPAACRLWQG